MRDYRVADEAKRPLTEKCRLLDVLREIGVDHATFRVRGSMREAVDIAGTRFHFAADGRLVRVEAI
jgi:hypothetical protein